MYIIWTLAAIICHIVRLVFISVRIKWLVRCPHTEYLSLSVTADLLNNYAQPPPTTQCAPYNPNNHLSALPGIIFWYTSHSQIFIFLILVSITLSGHHHDSHLKPRLWYSDVCFAVYRLMQQKSSWTDQLSKLFQVTQEQPCDALTFLPLIKSWSHYVSRDYNKQALWSWASLSLCKNSTVIWETIRFAFIPITGATHFF